MAQRHTNLVGNLALLSQIFHLAPYIILASHPRNEWNMQKADAEGFVGIYAPGSALELSSDSFQIEAPENVTLKNGTLSAWIIIKNASTYESWENDMHVLGYPYTTGPSLSIRRTYRKDNPLMVMGYVPRMSDGRHVSCQSYRDQNNIRIADGKWHHIVMTYSSWQLIVYVDMVVSSKCVSSVCQTTPVAEAARTIHVGVNSPTQLSNKRAFQGTVDEVAIIEDFIDERTLKYLYYGNYYRLPVTSDRQRRILLHCGLNNNLYCQSDISTTRLKLMPHRRSRAKYVPSEALVYGHTLVRKIRSLPNGTTKSMVIKFEGNGMSYIKIRQVHVKSRDCDGILSWGLGREDGIRLSKWDNFPYNISTGTATTFAAFFPDSNCIGTTEIHLTPVSFREWSLTRSLILRYEITKNSPPSSGYSGRNLFCNGIDGFAFNEEFKWPLRKYANNQITSEPLTIEFWAYPHTAIQRSSVILSGGNYAPGLSKDGVFNLNKRKAVAVVRAPSQVDKISMRVGSLFQNGPDIPTKGSWSHYAITYDYEKYGMKFYVNGVLTSKEERRVPFENQTVESMRVAKGLTLCTYTYWESEYFEGYIDELRIWNYSRSGTEIRRDMSEIITGSEPNLIAYYDFEVEINGTIPDRGPNKYDLRVGGCAPCEVDFMGYQSMEYALDKDFHQYAHWYNGSLAGFMPVCRPAAYSTKASEYIDGTVYGGHPCYYSPVEGRTRKQLKQGKLTYFGSKAPLNARSIDRTVSSAKFTELELSGSDPDTEDIPELRRRILTVPKHGQLYYSSGKTMIPITSTPFLLPMSTTGEHIIYYKSWNSSNGSLVGGESLDRFEYLVTDGLLDSPSTSVSLSIRCPDGQVARNGTCIGCPRGSHLPKKTETRHNHLRMATACDLCGQGQYQDETGQQTCKTCPENHMPSVRHDKCIPCLYEAKESWLVSDKKCPILVSSSAMKSNLTIEIDEDYEVVDREIKDIPVPTAVYITSQPRFGTLHASGKEKALFSDNRVSPLGVIQQYIDRVISICGNTTLRERDLGIIGEPKVHSHKYSSDEAWGICDQRRHPYSYASNTITVGLAHKVYVMSMTFYENFRPGALRKIEGYDERDATWRTLWVGQPKQSSEEKYRLWHISSLCPTSGPIDTLRVTLQSPSAGMASQLAAIQVVGSNQWQAWEVPLMSRKLRYVPFNTNLDAEITDTFGYKVKRCRNGGVTEKYVTVKIARQMQPKTFSGNPDSMTLDIAILAPIICALLVFVFLYNRLQKKKQQSLHKELAQARNTIPKSALVASEDVILQSELGRGASGIVYRGSYRGMDVAVKVLSSLDIDNAERCKNEVEIEAKRMCELRHPNIVIFMGCCLEPNNSFIMSQYCERGSLFDILHDPYIEVLPWICRLRLAVGATRGVVYLHSASPPYLHRDIKSLNILVDDSWTAKLADFGALRVVEVLKHISNADPSQLTSLVGTTRWTAPELLLGTSCYTTASDVYSLGVVLWEIATRRLPYDTDKFSHSVEEKIRNGITLLFDESTPMDIPEGYGSLAQACFHFKPSMRPQACEILTGLEEILQQAERSSSFDSTRASSLYYRQPSML